MTSEKEKERKKERGRERERGEWKANKPRKNLIIYSSHASHWNRN